MAELMSENQLNRSLVLKGGTAINVYLLDVPRLSVDADFNFIGSSNWQEVQAARPEIDRLVFAVGTEQGYDVSREPYKVALQAYKLGYKGVAGNADNMKLEINYFDRVPALLPVEQREPWPNLEIDSPRVPCLQVDELAGMKVAALCNRGHPRDLYDVIRLSRLRLNAELVRKIALFQSLITDPKLGGLDPKRHHHISNRDVTSELTPLLRKREKVELEALISQADTVTASLLPLREEERSAVDALAEGRWDFESFFKGVRVNPDLAQHPGIMLRIRGPAVPRGVRGAK